MRRVLFDLLLNLLLFLLKKEKYPITTLAQELNGYGFVVVPTEQWCILVQNREAPPQVVE